MRPLARAVVLTAVTALAVGGLAAPAMADSPERTNADPAPNEVLDVDPAGVTLTFDQPLTLLSTIAVSGPSGTCGKDSPVLVPSTQLSCVFLPGDLADGTYTVTYSADPSSGTDPVTTGSYDFVLDAVAPPAPTGVAIAPDPYNAASTTLTVTGTSQSDDDTVEVEVTDGAATLTQTVDAGSGGAFSATFTAAQVAGLADGTLTATARSADFAGNQGPDSSDTSVKDTGLPAAPTVNALPFANQANSASFPVSGTGEPGASIALTVTRASATVTTTVAVALDGTWSAAMDVSGLSDGTLTVTATQTDAAGNSSPPSAPKTTTKDTGSPAAPMVNALPPFANQANRSTFPVSGTGEPVASVLVTITGTAGSVTRNATVQSDGTWNTTVNVTSLPDGPLTVTVTQTDAASNASSGSVPQATTKDTVAPPVPSRVSISPDPINVANQVAVTVSGESEGARVKITVSRGANSLTQTVDVSGGGYSTVFDVSSLADGGIAASVAAFDAAGNKGEAQVDLATKETVVPTKTASSPVEGSRVLPTSTVVLTFSEPLASGSIVISGVAGTSSRTGSTVTFTPAQPMPEGSFTATATVTDLRGNPGTGTVSFVVDDGFATTATTLNPLPAAVSYQKTITLSGQVTRPDKSVAALPVMVSMRDDAGRTTEIALVTPNASGAWSLNYRPTVNGTFTATYLGDRKNAASTSPGRTTKVRVSIEASTATGPASTKATVKGSVTPAKAGAVIRLYRVGKGGTKLLGTAKVKGGGRFTFKVRLPKGKTRLRVSIGATPGNLGGSERLTAFRT